MKKLAVLSAIAVVAAPGAFAQDIECDTPGCELANTVFETVEKNPNEMIDLGEFVEFGQGVFASMDADENRSIDFEEFTTFDFGFNFIAEEAGRMDAYQTAQRILFAFWDRDGDGVIGSREMRAAMSLDFNRADVNDDSQLSRDEVLRHYIVNVAYRAAITGN